MVRSYTVIRRICGGTVTNDGSGGIPWVLIVLGLVACSKLQHLPTQLFDRYEVLVGLS